MQTTTTKVTVLRETPCTLVVTTEDSPGQVIISTRMGHYVQRLPIKIPKRYVLEGSDMLGIPSKKDKKDKHIDKGDLVIPKWLATQRCIWER